MGVMRTRPRSPWAPAVLAGLVAAACTTEQFISQAGVPGTSTPAKIVSVVERGEYLDTTIETGGTALRFYLPASEECRTVVNGDFETARYQNLGPLGRLTRGEVRCDPLGILSLRAWRDRRPRGVLPKQTIPRAAARFQEIRRDADLVLLQGRFPLAGYIGWVGGVATRAVVPVDPVCEDAIASGTASMEYRPAGKLPFTLVASKGLCEIVGFVYERPPQMDEAIPTEDIAPSEPVDPLEPGDPTDANP